MSTQRHLHVHVQNLRNCVHTRTGTIHVNETTIKGNIYLSIYLMTKHLTFKNYS